jgi:hypothetical protein
LLTSSFRITKRERIMSNPNPPVASRLRARLPAGLGLIALLGYALLLGSQTIPVAGGADSSGYFNSGRLLASGHLSIALRAPPEFGPRASLDPLHFLPQGFFPGRDRTRLTPTYPTGLPLHLAAAGALFGWERGAQLLLVAAAIGAVALTYLAARALGIARPLAAAGAVVLAAFPVFLFTSIQPLSDTLATLWSTAALVAALRARARPVWAAAAGTAFALAVLVRPTNLLLAPGLLWLFGRAWRTHAWFALGGLPGAAWLAFYNHTLYGHPLASGYGDIFSAFSLAYGTPTAVHFARWLALLLPFPLLLTPFAALARPESRTRELAALALLFLPVAGCYVFYEVSREVWWCLRFILPVVPVLILAGLLGIEALARLPACRQPQMLRRAAAVALALWALGLSWYWTPRLAVFMVKHYEQAYAEGAAAARERFPATALVLCQAFSGTLYFYTDFPALRWDQIEAPAFYRYAALARSAGRPVCAVLFESEEADAFRRCPGAWTRVAKVRNVGLWQLAADPPPSR